MLRKIAYYFLLLFLLADTGYSFLQHYNKPFDGDMAGGIVPGEDVKPILGNPFGVKAITEHQEYPNPNRFFSHWFFYEYFNTVPILLQKVTSPINSAYLACALSKTFIQIILILSLAIAITGYSNPLKFNFILAAFLVTPLFQTNGYRGYMGIIDPATTYTFFYALPVILIILYFTPLFLTHFYGKKITVLKFIKFLWIPLALISSLSGPLNSGISLVISLLLLSHRFIQNLKTCIKSDIFARIKYGILNIPSDYYFYIVPISIFSLYSLYLGQFNSINSYHNTSFIELYSKLPQGIFYSFTQKLGFPVLFIALIINAIIIKRINLWESSKIMRTYKWIAIFSLAYILLLPMGGYRDYRPFILRYDTIIPITLSLMFLFGKSTIFIFNSITPKQNKLYTALIACILFVFIYSDKPEFGQNECERNAIMQIAKSSNEIVELSNPCTIMSWGIIEKPSESELKTKLLKRWKIINDDKLFYQPTNNK